MRTRIAVIGVGAWGINHVRVLRGEPTCELTAIVDPDPSVAQRVRDVAWFADAQPVLADPTVDAVVIATPSVTHADLAIAALRAGKHVLVEKPLALSLASARDVAAAARASVRVAMVGHLMVYHPAIVHLRQLLGTLGPIQYFHATRANLRPRRDEHVLWSFGPHDLSMIDYLIERSPESVSARGREEVVVLALRYATGEMAHIHLSWLHPRKERRLTVIGAAKMVEFDDVASEKLRIYDKAYERPPHFTQFAEYLTLRDADVYIPAIAMEEPLHVEIQHFLACIEAGSVPTTSVERALRIVAVLDAAQQSLLHDGAPVGVST